MVEKTGAIRIIQNGKLLATPFLNIAGRVSGGSEQGLLSLAFDPHYATNGRFYVYYTNTSGDIRVVRYTVSSGDPNVANAGIGQGAVKVAHHAHPNHNGGQLAFGPDGRLYIGVGDGGSEGDPNNYGQNRRCPTPRSGGSTSPRPAPSPSSTPTACATPGASRSTRKTGNLWIGDVGQNHWEEIDFLKAGRQARHQLRLELLRGRPRVYKPQHIVRTRLVFPVTEYSHSRRQRGRRRLRLSGQRHPRPARLLPLRRLRQRRASGSRPAARRARTS